MATAFLQIKHRPRYMHPVSSGESRPETLDLAIRTSRYYFHSKLLAPRPTERRKNARYELQLELDAYSMRSEQPVWLGTGQTLNWSRTSILVRCDRPLAHGSIVQLVVRWRPGVQLVVAATVLRAEERGMVLHILRKRFRGRPAPA
jgi:hypothetical protein